MNSTDGSGSATQTATSRSDQRQLPRSPSFAALTDREQVVLAQLMDGHCAEEIAKAGTVSISTVRSQIKAILQKLDVNSQLAAVALARRAGWSFHAPVASPKARTGQARVS